MLILQRKGECCWVGCLWSTRGWCVLLLGRSFHRSALLNTLACRLIRQNNEMHATVTIGQHLRHEVIF